MTRFVDSRVVRILRCPATRCLIALIVSLSVAGCATTSTLLVDVDPEAIEAEEIVQRELVLQELSLAQGRLDNLAFELLVASVPFCGERTAPRFGFRYDSASNYEGDWADAAVAALGLSDSLSITGIVAGSPADEAGLLPGDVLLAVNGETVPVGGDATNTASELLQSGSGAKQLTVRRSSESVDLSVNPVTTCRFQTIVVVEGDINAFADGERVIIPWAMMRFATDDELIGVLAHEIAHNAMGHIEARRKNALLGGIFGAILDVAAATQGVNTGGQNTAIFMAAAARSFSQDFEREADYVGMYILARAGKDLETVPNFWRQFAQINPRAISYASTHPTTAERFVRLSLAAEEIERKRAEGQDLMPEMKDGDGGE